MQTFFDAELLSEFASVAIPSVLDAAAKSFPILALAGLAVLRLRRASAATRHLVWFLAVASLLLLPALSLVLPGWEILPHWIEKAEAPSASNNTELLVHATKHDESKNVSFVRDSVTSSASELWAELSAVEARPSLMPRGGVTSANDARPLEVSLWGLCLWLTGALFALLPAVLGVFSLWRLGRTSRTVTERTWLDLLRRLVASLSFHKNPFDEYCMGVIIHSTGRQIANHAASPD